MDAREDGVYITYVPSSGADSVTKKLGSEPQLLGTLTGNGTFDCKKIANYKQLTKDNFFTRMEQRALKKSDTVRRARFWGLFIFVAIPLPGTGAWTGSLIAAMLEMRVKEAFPPIALGVVTAGIIVAVVTYGAASLLF